MAKTPNKSYLTVKAVYKMLDVTGIPPHSMQYAPVYVEPERVWENLDIPMHATTVETVPVQLVWENLDPLLIDLDKVKEHLVTSKDKITEEEMMWARRQSPKSKHMMLKIGMVEIFVRRPKPPFCGCGAPVTLYRLRVSSNMGGKRTWECPACTLRSRWETEFRESRRGYEIRESGRMGWGSALMVAEILFADEKEQRFIRERNKLNVRWWRENQEEFVRSRPEHSST